MTARIYKPAKTAMQSGTAKTKDWIVEFEAEAARTIDPLMGWTSSSDTKGQVRLSFETREAAIAFARRSGLDFTVVEPKAPRRRPRAYADNFAFDRKAPWTH